MGEQSLGERVFLELGIARRFEGKDATLDGHNNASMHASLLAATPADGSALAINEASDSTLATKPLPPVTKAKVCLRGAGDSWAKADRPHRSRRW
jgi:hypothetical protein